MECKETGEFAHRESTQYEQTEVFNKETVSAEHGTEEYVHLKSKDDEYEHLESNMPNKQRAQEEAEAQAEAEGEWRGMRISPCVVLPKLTIPNTPKYMLMFADTAAAAAAAGGMNEDGEPLQDGQMPGSEQGSPPVCVVEHALPRLSPTLVLRLLPSPFSKRCAVAHAQRLAAARSLAFRLPPRHS